jgi:hypothetical protein
VQAAQMVGYGFEIGDHPSDGQQCGDDWTYAELYAQYATDLTTWRAKYSSVPSQVSSRYHCYSWDDWDMMPRVNRALGVKYDLNTVAYPASWVNSNSPMVTGSGMNMRLTDTSGALLDVHQGVTNFDNTAADSMAIAAMFDNAVGVKGYYGLFGSHYDMGPNDQYHDMLVNMAKSRHIPIISADQALEWLTSRERSTISQLASPSIGQVTFRVTPSEGAHGLKAMLPSDDASGHIGSLRRDGQLVNYQTEMIKGVSYITFEARSGQYDARYSDYGKQSDQSVGTSPPIKATNIAARQSDVVSAEGEVSVPQNQTPTTYRYSSGDSTDSRQQPTDGPWYTRPIAWASGLGVAVILGGVGWWAIAMRRH